MQQYFENRTLMLINDIEDNCNYDVPDKLFINERPDEKFHRRNISVKNATFAKIGLKGVDVELADFSFSTFIDCYFRGAKFENVDFKSCTFINCNFEGATFISCIFNYAKFQNCHIKFDQIKHSLPTLYNLRWYLCRDLSIECLKTGDVENYRKFFFEEKKASEHHYLKMFLHTNSKEDNYYKKYDGFLRIKGLSLFLASKLNKIIWGYGEKVRRLLLNIAIIVGAFGLLDWWALSKNMFTGIAGVSTNFNLFTAVYISACNFLTIDCMYMPVTFHTSVWVMIEGALGVMFMGFFVASIFRYINRRS